MASKRAQRPKRPTIAQINNMDLGQINQTTRQEMALYVRVLADAANKRIKRLQAKSEDFRIESEALQAIERGGPRGQGKFSTANKTLPQLRAEFVRARGFLDAQTSTIKGTQKTIMRRKNSALGFLYQKDLAYRKEFFEIFNNIRENNPLLMHSLGYGYGVLTDEIQAAMEASPTKSDPLETALQVQEKLKRQRAQENKLEPFFRRSNWDSDPSK